MSYRCDSYFGILFAKMKPYGTFLSLLFCVLFQRVIVCNGKFVKLTSPAPILKETSDAYDEYYGSKNSLKKRVILSPLNLRWMLEEGKNVKHQEELNRMKQNHEDELNLIKQNHTNELNILKQKHDNEKKKLELEHKKEIIQLQRNLSELEYITELQKHERLKELVVPLIRTDLENQEIFYLPAIHLTKEIMIDDVKQLIPEFKIPRSMTENYELSLHYVTWVYILKNSKDPDVQQLKKYVNMYHPELGIDDIARIISIFYKDSSTIIPGTVGVVSLDELEKALFANGIKDELHLFVIKAVFGVPRGMMDNVLNKNE